MRTTPVLSDSPNGQGFWEIRWSEKRGGQWRSMRRSTRTADRTEAELVLGRFMISRAQAPVEMVGRATVDDCSAYYLREWSLPRGNDVTDDFVLRPVRRGMGRMLADAVTQDDVDAYARARSKGLYGKKGFKAAPSTIRREVTGLQAMLNFCSRKGMIGTMTGRPVEQRAVGSAAAALLAAQGGALLVRVHDVVETRDALAVLHAVGKPRSGKQAAKPFGSMRFGDD